MGDTPNLLKDTDDNNQAGEDKIEPMQAPAPVQPAPVEPPKPVPPPKDPQEELAQDTKDQLEKNDIKISEVLPPDSEDFKSPAADKQIYEDSKHPVPPETGEKSFLGDVGLPHQPSDLKPDELIEPNATDLALEQGETFTDESRQANLKDKDITVVEEDKVALPEVYTKGAEPPVPVPDSVLDKYSDPPPPLVAPDLAPKPEPVPKVPKLTRAESETADNFSKRFRHRLLELLHVANQKRSSGVEDNLEKILDYAWEHNKITNDDVEKITGVEHVQSAKYLKMLTKQGKLVKFGKTSNTFYKPVKK